MTVGVCPTSAACAVREVGNHRDRDLTAELTSGQSAPEFLDTAGCRTPGLDCCVVSFVWENGSWGYQMSHIGQYIPLLAAGMEGRDGRERICYDLPSCGGRAPLGGKRQLIWGGGSTSRISNGTRSQNPGGGGETWLAASRKQPNPRGLVEVCGARVDGLNWVYCT